jgi:hypothetical protein
MASNPTLASLAKDIAAAVEKIESRLKPGSHPPLSSESDDALELRQNHPLSEELKIAKRELLNATTKLQQLAMGPTDFHQQLVLNVRFRLDVLK